MLSSLTRIADCNHCSQRVHLTLCSDGKRRPFELEEQPAGLPGVWSWRRGHGMEENGLYRGYRVHSCEE
jgi:hypothetical protein